MQSGPGAKHCMKKDTTFERVTKFSHMAERPKTGLFKSGGNSKKRAYNDDVLLQPVSNAKPVYYCIY